MNKTTILYILLGVVIIGFLYWWLPYKYNDCMQVGHTKTYCILRLWE